MDSLFIGINSVIEIIIMKFYFDGILNKNSKHKLRNIIGFILAVIYVIKSIINIPSLANLLLSVTIASGIAFVNYKDKYIKKIFSVILYVTILIASEIISSNILSVCLSSAYSEIPELNKVQMAFMTNFISFAVIIYIIKIPAKKMNDIPLTYWFVILSMPVFSFSVMLIFDIITITSDIPYINLFNAFIMAGFVYLNIAIFDFFESYSDRIRLRETEAILKINKENYKILEKNEERLRILKHDIKKHINTMRKIAQSGNSENITEYADELERISTTITSVTYTNNLTLDSVLNIEAVKASALQIKYFVKSNIQSDIYIDDVTLTMIFYNAIDNAIEASKDTEQKYVVITINVYKEDIEIVVENSCKAGIIKDGMFVTTKTDTENHGFGIPSIKQGVDLYSGKMKMSQQNNINTLKIYLKNTSEKFSLV